MVGFGWYLAVLCAEWGWYNMVFGFGVGCLVLDFSGLGLC